MPAWEDVKDAAGETKDRRLPPRRYRLAYLVTAWTQRPEDEHRLLSALLGCFIRNAMLKPEASRAKIAEDQPARLHRRRPATVAWTVPLADVWSALGGELKPSLDVVVTAPMVVGRTAVRTARPRRGRRSAWPPPQRAQQGSQREWRRSPAADNLPLVLPEETVPKTEKDDQPGVKLRVRGRRVT